MEVQIASGIGEGRSVAEALERAAAGISTDVDLVCVFGPAEWFHEQLVAELRSRFGTARLIGCSASGVIGGGREVEGRGALSLSVARLPGVSLDWVDLEARGPAEGEVVVTLADPGYDVERLLFRLEDRRAGRASVPIVGAIASGGRPGRCRLLRDDQVMSGGALALSLKGPLEVRTLVAQGCRPIGEPLLVVRSNGREILELDRGRPLDVLRALRARVDEHERRLMGRALFLGLQMREQRRPYAAGDFLVRPMIGADAERGSIAVAHRITGYPVVQFHVRDGRASAADLEAQLAKQDPGSAGALVFSCVGRGEGLYGVPDHDSDQIRRRLLPGAEKPHAPVGGFFGNGEIGPVGDSAYLHNFTTVVLFLRALSDSSASA